MKISGRTGMSIALMLIAGAVFLTALQWPLKTAIFPLTIAGFTFVLAAVEVFLGLLKKNAKETSTMDFQMSNAESLDIDEATVRKRVSVISLWIFGFFALILLVGFPVAIPLFFVIFLKLYAKEKWTLTLILAAVAWAFFYGLFIQLLHLPFEDGWIIQGLQALGVLG